MPEMISNLTMNYYFIVQFNNAILFHDEVYSRNASCPLSLISAFLIIAFGLSIVRKDFDVIS
jgi:hypothetical protein